MHLWILTPLFLFLFSCESENLSTSQTLVKSPEKERPKSSAPDGLPFLHSLEGADRLTIVSSSGKKYKMKKGGFFKKGDRFETDSQTAARLIYSDGSQVLIGHSSKVEIQENSLAQNSLELKKGKIRGLIESSRSQKKMKFHLKTRSAVMGVRGTDFVTISDQKQSSFYVIEGMAEVAKSDHELKREVGQPVKGGSFTQTKRTRKYVPKSKPFAAKPFLSKLDQENPKLSQLFDDADRDQKTGRLRSQYRKLKKTRNSKRDEINEVKENKVKKQKAKAQKKIQEKKKSLKKDAPKLKKPPSPPPIPKKQIQNPFR